MWDGPCRASSASDDPLTLTVPRRTCLRTCGTGAIGSGKPMTHPFCGRCRRSGRRQAANLRSTGDVGPTCRIRHRERELIGAARAGTGRAVLAAGAGRQEVQVPTRLHGARHRPGRGLDCAVFILAGPYKTNAAGELTPRDLPRPPGVSGRCCPRSRGRAISSERASLRVVSARSL
jgi:hypothetical protein